MCVYIYMIYTNVILNTIKGTLHWFFIDLSHHRRTLCKCNNTYIHSEIYYMHLHISSNIKYFSYLVSITSMLSNFTHFWMWFNDITLIYDGRHAAAGKNVIDYGSSEISSSHWVMRREEWRFVIDIR